MAFALTLLFKSDKDVSGFESGLGKLKDTDPDIVPLNTGRRIKDQTFFVIRSLVVLTYLMHSNHYKVVITQYGSIRLLLKVAIYAFTAILTSNNEVDVAKVESARKERYLDNKVRAMLREIVWQLVMAVLFTWVIVGPLDSNVYHQNQDIRNAFVEDAAVHT